MAEHMRAHGIDVRLGVNVDAIVRDEEAPCGACASRGAGNDGGARRSRPTSWSATIGVVPNTGFLAGQRADALARAARSRRTTRCGRPCPDVWAAGDCANVTWADGSRRPEQLWYTARDQGRVAARSMLGDEVAYRRGTWYNSAKFFDLE